MNSKLTSFRTSVNRFRKERKDLPRIINWTRFYQLKGNQAKTTGVILEKLLVCICIMPINIYLSHEISSIVYFDMATMIWQRTDKYVRPPLMSYNIVPPPKLTGNIFVRTPSPFKLIVTSKPKSMAHDFVLSLSALLIFTSDPQLMALT